MLFAKELLKKPCPWTYDNKIIETLFSKIKSYMRFEKLNEVQFQDPEELLSALNTYFF